MDDVEIIAYDGFLSAIEGNQSILILLGIMTARFNVLENNLSTLICIKSKIILKGSVYNHISKELYLVQKIKMAEDFLGDKLPSKLYEINNKRNKIIHGLYTKNMRSGSITLNYKKEKIINLDIFLTELNNEISNICEQIHGLILNIR